MANLGSIIGAIGQRLETLAEREVHHRTEQIVAAADVVVDESRRDAELARQPGDGDLRQRLPLRQCGCTCDHRLARQLKLRVRALSAPSAD